MSTDYFIQYGGASSEDWPVSMRAWVESPGGAEAVVDAEPITWHTGQPLATVFAAKPVAPQYIEATQDVRQGLVIAQVDNARHRDSFSDLVMLIASMRKEWPGWICVSLEYDDPLALIEDSGPIKLTSDRRWAERDLEALQPYVLTDLPDMGPGPLPVQDQAQG